jgi:hypothetical protein
MLVSLILRAEHVAADVGGDQVDVFLRSTDPDHCSRYSGEDQSGEQESCDNHLGGAHRSFS